jgi:hypothetical protein
MAQVTIWVETDTRGVNHEVKALFNTDTRREFLAEAERVWDASAALATVPAQVGPEDITTLHDVLPER